jgi:hypothetical protein
VSTPPPRAYEEMAAVADCEVKVGDFCGLLAHTDVRKVPRAFMDPLADTLCYAA